MTCRCSAGVLHSAGSGRSISATRRSKFDPVRRWGREGPSPTAIVRNSRSQTCVETPVSSQQQLLRRLQGRRTMEAELLSASGAGAAHRRRPHIDEFRALRGGVTFHAVDRHREFFPLGPQDSVLVLAAMSRSDNTSHVNGAFLSRGPPPRPLGPATTHHPSTASIHSHDPRRPSCSQLMTMPRGPEPRRSKLPGGFVTLGTAGARPRLRS